MNVQLSGFGNANAGRKITRAPRNDAPRSTDAAGRAARGTRAPTKRRAIARAGRGRQGGRARRGKARRAGNYVRGGVRVSESRKLLSIFDDCLHAAAKVSLMTACRAGEPETRDLKPEGQTRDPAPPPPKLPRTDRKTGAGRRTARGAGARRGAAKKETRPLPKRLVIYFELRSRCFSGFWLRHIFFKHFPVLFIVRLVCELVRSVEEPLRQLRFHFGELVV